MSSSERSSRRRLFVQAGLLLNGVVGVMLAVPIVRYLLSPVGRNRKRASRAWVSLGRVASFPAGSGAAVVCAARRTIIDRTAVAMHAQTLHRRI